MSQTYFNSCIAVLDGYISVGTAKNITIDGLSLTKSTRNTDLKPTSLVKLSTASNGNLTVNNLSFSQNKIRISIIDIDDTVGSLIIQNSVFSYETIASTTPYISIQSINQMVLMNTTFENIQIGNSIVEIQPLLYLRKIKIDTNGDVLFNTLTITN